MYLKSSRQKKDVPVFGTPGEFFNILLGQNKVLSGGSNYLFIIVAVILQSVMFYHVFKSLRVFKLSTASNC